MKAVTLNLPQYLLETLKTYQKNGYVNFNNFIEKSVKRYIYSTNSQIEELVLLTHSQNTINTTIKFDNTTYSDLAQLSQYHSIDISEIVATALAFSIPALIDGIETIEESVLAEVV